MTDDYRERICSACEKQYTAEGAYNGACPDCGELTFKPVPKFYIDENGKKHYVMQCETGKFGVKFNQGK